MAKKEDMEKIRIPVEYVLNLSRLRGAVNAPAFWDIVWTLEGKDIDVPKRVKTSYMYCGLNNFDFITSDYWAERPWKHLQEE